MVSIQQPFGKCDTHVRIDRQVVESCEARHRGQQLEDFCTRLEAGMRSLNLCPFLGGYAIGGIAIQ